MNNLPWTYEQERPQGKDTYIMAAVQQALNLRTDLTPYNMENFLTPR